MDVIPYSVPDIEMLYNRYADTLYRIAYAELLSKEDAEDAIQEVFAKFLRKPSIFRDSEHEKAWFLRVTINKCHDFLRKRKVRNYTPLEDMTEIQTGEKNEDSILENVLALPEKFKTVILLFYFEDNSVDEISKILGISHSAVKMRLARGREMLKINLKEE